MLFTPAQLGDWLGLGGPADPERSELAARAASGWLQAATGITTWPEEIPDDIFGWALELGAAVYSNPRGLVSLTVGNLMYGYGGDRLQQIMTAAGARGGGNTGPRFSFPAPTWGETGYISG